MDSSYLFIKVEKWLNCPYEVGTLIEIQSDYAKKKKKTYDDEILKFTKGTCPVSKWPFLHMSLFNLNLLLFQFNTIYSGFLPSSHTNQR